MNGKVSEMVSGRIGQTIANVRAFGDAFYNVMAKPYEAAGDGIKDDTAIFQKVVDDANAAGRRAVYCPHGTYRVTSLTNDSNIIFFGDNATFTGGYDGTINQMGAFSDVSDADFNALKAETALHRKTTDEYNRPARKLPPSFGAWEYVGRAISNDLPWKNQYAGIGYDVVWDDETQRYAMIYCGSATGGTTTFGLAYSDDAINWTDYASNPTFAHTGVPGDPDQGGVTFPQLVRHDNKWYMYYIGFPGAGYEIGEPKICYATATSLLGPWTRHGAIITKGMFPVEHGVEVLYRPTVLQVGTRWYMFNNAGPSIGVEDIYYFYTDDLDSPWTLGSRVLTGTQFDTAGSNTLASDPEIIRFGDQFIMLLWSGGGDIHMAYCDVSEFPATWHPVDAALSIPTTAPRRPVWVETPEDRLLILNTVGASVIDVYRQTVKRKEQLVKLTNNAAQSIPNDAATILALNTPIMNDFFMMGTNRIIVRQPGVYMITGMIAFASNPTGDRAVYIRKNGTEIGRTRMPAATGGPTHLPVMVTEGFIANDYIEIGAYQKSGGALNVEYYANGISPVLTAVKVSD